MITAAVPRFISCLAVLVCPNRVNYRKGNVWAFGGVADTRNSRNVDTEEA